MSSTDRAILDLLTAFGIETSGVQSVTIEAGYGKPVEVALRRLVLSADPSQIEERYDVTAALSDTRSET